MASEQNLKRTLRLKDNLLSSKYEICIERMKFFTEAYQNHPEDPPVLKRAKAVAHTLRNMTIFIREELARILTERHFSAIVDHDAAGYLGKSPEEIGPRFKALAEEWQNG